MPRATSEWRGKTDDSVAPPRVRLRVFDRDGGRCQSCKRKIRPSDKWDTDHRVAIINGGMNRENNLQTLCSWCHKAKTAEDVKEKSDTYRKRCKALGIKPQSINPVPGSKNSPWASRFNKHTGKFETVRRDEL